MRSREDDRHTAAVIRDAAMDLFAERGAPAVTVRAVAQAAGVSPGLVMHHFGSKDGLKRALDRRAAAFVEAMLGELARIGEAGGAASLATMLADHLEREPVLMAYVRRLLLDGGEEADALFGQLFQVTVAGMSALVDMGIVRPAHDERLRAAFLLVNDLAMMAFRPQMVRVVGVDPLAGNGRRAWAGTAPAVSTDGLFVRPDPAPVPATRVRKERTRR